MWPMGLFFKCVSLYYIIAYRLSVKWFQHLVLKVISSVKQDRRQVPEMRYQRFFFYFVEQHCWKIWDEPKNANYSEMTIHHHKFYGIDKQNGMRLKIACNHNHFGCIIYYTKQFLVQIGQWNTKYKSCGSGA